MFASSSWCVVFFCVFEMFIFLSSLILISVYLFLLTQQINITLEAHYSQKQTIIKLLTKNIYFFSKLILTCLNRRQTYFYYSKPLIYSIPAWLGYIFGHLLNIKFKFLWWTVDGHFDIVSLEIHHKLLTPCIYDRTN